MLAMKNNHQVPTSPLAGSGSINLPSWCHPPRKSRRMQSKQRQKARERTMIEQEPLFLELFKDYEVLATQSAMQWLHFVAQAHMVIFSVRWVQSRVCQCLVRHTSTLQAYSFATNQHRLSQIVEFSTTPSIDVARSIKETPATILSSNAMDGNMAMGHFQLLLLKLTRVMYSF